MIMIKYVDHLKESTSKLIELARFLGIKSYTKSTCISICQQQLESKISKVYYLQYIKKEIH